MLLAQSPRLGGRQAGHVVSRAAIRMSLFPTSARVDPSIRRRTVVLPVVLSTRAAMTPPVHSFCYLGMRLFLGVVSDELVGGASFIACEMVRMGRVLASPSASLRLMVECTRPWERPSHVCGPISRSTSRGKPQKVGPTSPVFMSAPVRLSSGAVMVPGCTSRVAGAR